MIILCLFLQYSGLNELVFNSFRYEIRFSIGRLIEIIPFACIGLLLGNKDLNKIKTKRWYIIIISIILFLVTMKIQHFIECDGYGFSGFDNIIYAILLFIIAYCFGIEKKEKPYWPKYIFTYGIYMSHYMVGIVIEKILILNKIQTGTFLECIYIFVISNLISYGIRLLPIKNIKQFS